MKINIVTLHRARNYGSVLQTLATQMFFEEFGCETEIIDYYPERYTSRGLLNRLKNKSDRLRSNPFLLILAKIAISFSYLKKHIIFNNFLKMYINLTYKTFRNEKELKKYCFDADAYCTGSDQVWNSHWNEGVDKPLFLDFLPENAFRFSFASSIGNSELKRDEEEIIAPLLSKYQHISVREDSAVCIVKKLGFLEVEHLLDPTLLYDKRQWEVYTSKKIRKRKYVVTYNLHHDKKIDIYASEIARKQKLELLNISYNWHDVLRRGKLIWCPNVEEYLSLLRDAEYVVTDSFHATAFSLIFETKFIDIFPQKASSRLKSLLYLTNTMNRGFEGMPPIEAADATINFKQIHHILKMEREKSVNYIKRVLQDIVLLMEE